MSYNGIGLQTARGSGTSGYVQRNIAGGKDGQANKDEKLGHHKSRKLQQQLEQQKQRYEKSQAVKKLAKTELLDHDAKRRIEIKCMELRDKLEDESEDEDVIEEEVRKLRAHLTDGAENTETKVDSQTKVSSGKVEVDSEKAKENPEKAKKDSKKTKEKDLEIENMKEETPSKRSKKSVASSNTYSYVPRYSERS